MHTPFLWTVKKKGKCWQNGAVLWRNKTASEEKQRGEIIHVYIPEYQKMLFTFTTKSCQVFFFYIRIDYKKKSFTI